MGLRRRIQRVIPEQLELVKIPLKRYRLLFRTREGYRPKVQTCVVLKAASYDWAIEGAYKMLFQKYRLARDMWQFLRAV